jgi:hypothetical protein
MLTGPDFNPALGTRNKSPCGAKFSWLMDLFKRQNCVDVKKVSVRLRATFKLGMVVHAGNPSTQVVKTQDASWRPVRLCL